MASRIPAGQSTVAGPGTLRRAAREGVRRSVDLIGGAALMALALALLLALLTYSQGDASLTTAAGQRTANWLGRPGAWLSSLLLLLVGWAALISPTLLARQAWYALRSEDALFPRRLWIGGTIATLLAALALGLWENLPNRTLTAGAGGFVSFVIERAIDSFGEGTAERSWELGKRVGAALLGIGALWLWWRSLQMSGLRLPGLGGLFAPRDVAEDEGGYAIVEERATLAQENPGLIAEPRRPVVTPAGPGPEIIEPASAATASRAPRAQIQSDMFASKSLPQLTLLKPAPNTGPLSIDKGVLDRNARLLETVLLDFQVKGVIKAVRQGPVVTMYELEPAPGTKASRVSNLAEDIARNMSALSARIAPIPGRTVIGIELPNAKTEPVVLHQLLSSAAFQSQAGELPIVLGKNIAGDPVIADLAPMPHLLIAGTTGSGKSVGLNAMILSLLYRLTPDQCRLIMIDPKMLELSIYDGIPHLLSPVVTEPAKAVRALKWAVEQMEDRYRMMSSLSVRNLAGYNEKVRAAKASGKSLRRRVQTGFHPDSGLPIYEEEQLDFDPLPQIVVVVDELADLMMTAGKEVEFLIQRLAQKARAAGIHLILATQRPSVDVITGVIKANLPTRISFHVTSKIDSRTILGEQGAEQLLGKGDMLYMPGGKQPIRIHGPFVSDDEVRAVADHWREQGAPTYVDAVTEEPADGGFALDGAPVGGDTPDERQYQQAVQIVVNSQRASTSSVQRALRIGYNTASRHIDRMEAEGIVSAPNHLGRRDVMVDRNGEAR